MSINELLKQAGVKFSHQDASQLGRLIMNKAKEKNVRWIKKEEMVSVNDFPGTFTEEMQQIVINYFTSKSAKK